MKEKIVQMTQEQFQKRQQAFKDFGWTIDSPTQRSMPAEDFLNAVTDHAYTTKLHSADKRLVC